MSDPRFALPPSGTARLIMLDAERIVTEGVRDANAAVGQMIAWYMESGLPFELVTLAGGWKVPRPRLRLAVVLESGALAAVLPTEKGE